MSVAAIDWSAGHLLAVAGAGVVAGFVNTAAGGGSLLTLPVLALAGLPWDVANGSNRVAILAQSIVAVASYRRHGRLELGSVSPLLLPSLVGAGLGAGAATIIDPRALEPIIVAALLAVALLMALRPRAVLPDTPGDRAARVRPAVAGLLLAAVGFYGGFLQAGVGYLLLAVLGGVLRHELVAANALKILVVGAYTVLALTIFAATGLVDWVAGAVLSVGSVVGTLVGVRFTLRAPPAALRWVIFATLIVTCAAVVLR